MTRLPRAPIPTLPLAVLLTLLTATAGCVGQLSGSDSDSDVAADEETSGRNPSRDDGGVAVEPEPAADGGVAPTPGEPPADDGSAEPPEPATDAGPPPAPEQDAGAPPTTAGDAVSPSPYLPPRVPEPTTVPGLSLYNPHTDQPFSHVGSGHTHASPDHSGIDPTVQETRFRDLPNGNAHDFVWMTAHDLVIHDPGVSGLLHMYGAEIYTGTLPSGGSPHVLAYMPDGTLAGRSDPFGPRYQPLDDTVRAIAAAGGLPVMAHPSRYSPSLAETVAASDRLWGLEVVSGGTDPADNARFVDARLSAGKYACLSAGGDTHDEDWSLTRGYQLVASSRASAEQAEIFQRVRSCDFFACRVGSESDAPLQGLRVTVDGGEILVTADETLDAVDFVGADGRLLHDAGGSSAARYRLVGDESYVRVRAYRAAGQAECFSQPLWVYRS